MLLFKMQEGINETKKSHLILAGQTSLTHGLNAGPHKNHKHKK